MKHLCTRTTQDRGVQVWFPPAHYRLASLTGIFIIFPLFANFYSLYPSIFQSPLLPHVFCGDSVGFFFWHRLSYPTERRLTFHTFCIYIREPFFRRFVSAAVSPPFVIRPSVSEHLAWCFWLFCSLRRWSPQRPQRQIKHRHWARGTEGSSRRRGLSQIVCK